MKNIGECSCLNPDAKMYLHGAIVHWIRELEEEAKDFKSRAEERKGTPMEEHYLGVASGVERYVENLEMVKAIIKDLPECKRE